MELAHFDAHSHAQFPDFDADRAAVLGRARAAGVGVVCAGATFASSEAAVRLARGNEGVWAAVGLHPTDAAEGFDRAAFEALARDPKTVAVGECGLEYYRLEGSAEDIAETKRAQKELFVAHMEIAHAVGKPLVVHCRDAMSDLLEILRANRGLLVPDSVMHFFCGTPEEARALLDLGFCFTFGGVVTFARAYDETVRAIPADRLLSETDAPYVAPVPFRGKRCEPVHAIETERRLAELKGLPQEEMARAIVANARRIFKI